MSEPRPTPPPGDVRLATERWFQRNGLPYFVPGERAAARDALRPRRLVPVFVVVVLVAAGAAAGLTWVVDDLSVALSLAPATLTWIAAAVAVFYALTALRARPIVRWAFARTVVSLPLLMPLVTRALPLLLIFITFLFINAEVWQVSSTLDGGVLWLTVLLFAAMAVGFLLVRLPEEVDRADDEVDDRRLGRACADTPLAETCRRLVDDPDVRPATYATVGGFERWNLILVLLIIQAVQVLLLAFSVFAFFMIFGAMVMTETVTESWIGGETNNIPGISNVSVELVQVSVFLAAFSGLYFTVFAVTDETYRGQFFSGVMQELERAIGVRAVYRAMLATESSTSPPST